jgi:TRAP-type C4-dicarboxylate transport system substrate-binding protein
MIDRRKFLGGAATAAVAAPFVLRRAYAANPEFTMKLHHLLGAKAPAQTKMLEPFAERIFKDSDGRVKIDIYPAMSLGGAPPQLVRQVADGVVDIIWTVNGYTPNLFPRSEVFELPTIFTNDIKATNLAMRDMYDQYLAEEFKDVHVLWLHVHAGQAIQMASKLVRKPDDMKGLKIRVPGPTGNAVVEALGATPVTMPVPDLPQALTTNVVDGALIPWEIIPALKLQDSTKYQIEGLNNWRLGTTTFQVTMNKNTWEKLPDDLKEVFNKATDEAWVKTVGDVWRASDNGGIKIAVDSGNEHIVLTAEETAAFEKALAPVVDRWIKERTAQGIDAKGLVDAARAAIAKHAS